MKYCPDCTSELISIPMDGVHRLTCASNCGFVNWNNPIPVVAGLIEVDGQYVLARNTQWPEGFFSLISGFVETAEDPELAMLRETEEELGLIAQSCLFIGHYPFPQMNQLIIAYVVKASGKVVTNEEIAETLLLSKDELLNYDFGPLILGDLVVKKWQSISSSFN